MLTYADVCCYYRFDSRDLHIVIRLSFGTLDILVSNVEKYPSRSLENVAWKSRASIGDPAIESGKFMLTYADVCCHTSYIYIYMYISRASIGDPAIESGKFMLTYADVCCHTSYIYIYISRASIGDPAIESGKFICVQTFDDGCCCMLTYADVC
jgi:hypothetical protein